MFRSEWIFKSFLTLTLFALSACDVAEIKYTELKESDKKEVNHFFETTTKALEVLEKKKEFSILNIQEQMKKRAEEQKSDKEPLSLAANRFQRKLKIDNLEISFIKIDEKKGPLFLIKQKDNENTEMILEATLDTIMFKPESCRVSSIKLTNITQDSDSNLKSVTLSGRESFYAQINGYFSEEYLWSLNVENAEALSFYFSEAALKLKKMGHCVDPKTKKAQ